MTDQPMFVCPRCHGALAKTAAHYECVACAQLYPIVLGIPDFRLFPDPWIGFQDDRDKARRVVTAAGANDSSLEDMVRAYWRMTPGTPRSHAERFTDYVMTAMPRTREWLSLLDPDPRESSSGWWLDIGTGTGDLLQAASERGGRIIGIDIAMRWLVVARRRLQIAGLDCPVVCANAEYLPFPDEAFDRVVSLGTLEHCSDAGLVTSESRRVLRRGGFLAARTVNRYTVLPEPHVGVWGVGYVPRRWADRYVQWRTGERYEHHRPLSPREARRLLRSAGFRSVQVDPAPLLSADRGRLGRLSRRAAPTYEALRAFPIANAGLRWVAPVLELRGRAA
jgi:ubiquinone/menaquinone biosynthesis C-methylase UbiE